MVIGNMYIGGCSVDRHYKNITEDIPDYRYCKITADGNRQWFKSSHLKDVIKDEAWDFVSIQQVSQDAGMPGTYAHLQEVVDWIRANAPQAEVVFHQTGIIWWNIKDGWPNISDAVVDYYFNKKLAYYFIKNVQQNVCCMVLDAKKGKFPVITVSDVASGRKVFEGDFSIAPNSKTEVGGIKEKEGAKGVYLIEYTVGGKVSRNHYLYGKAPFNFADYKEWMSKTGIYEYSCWTAFD